MSAAEPPTAIHVPPSKTSPLKEAAKATARFVALIAVLPVLVVFWLNALIVGRSLRQLRRNSCRCSRVSRASTFGARFFSRLLHCHHSTLVEFGTLSQAGAILDEHVYVGPRCSSTGSHLDSDVPPRGVQIPSGGKTHYFDDPSTPIK